MPVKETQRAAADRWDAKNEMVFQSVKIRKSLRDAFRAACAGRGDRVNTVLREFMERYVAGEMGGDAQNVTLPLDDVIAVCAILDSLALGNTRADRLIAETRDKLNRLRDAAINDAQKRP